MKITLEYLYIYHIYFQFQNIMKKIKAFTMIEILIISIVISTWLFAIFTAANHAKLVNQRIMQTIIANQLATEWTEIIYQTRNTNLLRYNKDKKRINECRLSINYNECIKTHPDHFEETILYTWNYYIETDENWKNTIILCNDTWCENQYDPRYAICLNDWVRNPCTSWHELWWDESRYWKFFRIIEWIWIYDMSRNVKWWWKITINGYSNNHSAQEYRFCSRVYRVWWHDWEIEICSTMTNFIKEQ